MQQELFIFKKRVSQLHSAVYRNLKEITDAFEKFVLLHEILVANPVHIRTSSFFHLKSL